MLIYNNENVCWFERIESQTTFDKITFQNITYQHGSVMCKEALNKTELENTEMFYQYLIHTHMYVLFD